MLKVLPIRRQDQILTLVQICRHVRISQLPRATRGFLTFLSSLLFSLLRGSSLRKPLAPRVEGGMVGQGGSTVFIWVILSVSIHFNLSLIFYDSQLLKGVTIASGGVLPNIHPELLKKRKGGKLVSPEEFKAKKTKVSVSPKKAPTPKKAAPVKNAPAPKAAAAKKGKRVRMS